MKGAGMLVVSLRGVNFWSHLGVLGKTPLYLAVKVSFRVALKEILKNHIYILLIHFIYSIHAIKV